jgi:hypothetical protein
MTATIHQFPTPPAIRSADAEPSVRNIAECLMWLLEKDKRNCRLELGLIADLLDPMIARMEADNG